MSGSFARNKGQRGEREVRDLIQPIVDKVCAELGLDAMEIKRNLNQSREGGHDLIGLSWIAIEVKRQEVLQLDKWWMQAEEQAMRISSSAIPVLIYKQNRQKWRVRMIGWLHGGDCGCKGLVDITVADFLTWFELRLRYELKQSNLTAPG